MGSSVGFIGKISFPGAGEREEKPCWWKPHRGQVSFLGVFFCLFWGIPNYTFIFINVPLIIYLPGDNHIQQISNDEENPWNSFWRCGTLSPVELRPAAQVFSVPWRFIRVAGTTPHKTQCYFIHLQPFNTINEDIQPSQNQPKTAKINQTSTHQPTSSAKKT